MKISIIIPAYNSEKYIQRSIRSAIDQNFDKNHYEIIVIDDASADSTLKVIQPFQDSIRIMKHKNNMGLAAARNTGIKSAKGRYIVNLDADDYIHQDLLHIESIFLNLNNNFDAVCCDYYIVDEHEDHLERKNAIENPIACGIMFRMEQLVDVGLYDEQFMAREEEDLRLRFIGKYQIHHIPLPLYRYRKHDDNLTKDKVLMKKYKEKIRKRHSPEKE